jgi:hypothetical protein
MKALLNQFIGGGQTKGEMMSAAGSGSQKMEGDSAGANTSSFTGLMMGFLGMNETPAPGANGTSGSGPSDGISGNSNAKGAAPSEVNKKENKSATGTSVLGMSAEVLGKTNSGEGALTQKSKTADGTSGSAILNGISGKTIGKAAILKTAEGEGKDNTNPVAAAKNLKTRSRNQTTESGKGAPLSKGNAPEGEGTRLKSAEGADAHTSRKLQAATNWSQAASNLLKVKVEAESKNADAKVKGSGNGSTNARVKMAESAAGTIRQELKSNGDAVDKKIITAGKNGVALEADKINGGKSNSGKRLDLSNSGAAKGNNVKPTAGKAVREKIPAPVAGKISTARKEQAASKQETASRAQAENIMKQSAGNKGQMVSEGKNNPAAAADVIKKVQQKQAKKLKMKAERGRAPEASGRRPAVQGSQSSTSASVQSGKFLLRKPAFSVKNLTPGKMISSEVPGKVEAGADTDTSLSHEGGQASEKGFKEIHLNDFKSTRLAEAAGGKKFGRHLGEISRQQAGKSRETARQNTQWKHHRFVLKDGKALNISARSTEGALQLQLNAGNGELGKVLQQHLQEIKQHVQQELNIKVDLQLQDFSGQQSNGENEAGSSSSTPTRSASNSGESSAAAPSATSTSSGTESMRYFGFNNNEWTA